MGENISLEVRQIIEREKQEKRNDLLVRIRLWEEINGIRLLPIPLPRKRGNDGSR